MSATSKLHTAAANDDVQEIKRLYGRPWWKRLLQGPIDLNAVDEEGETPLHRAVGFQVAKAQFMQETMGGMMIFRKDTAAALLLELGATVDARNKDQVTPLHMACSCNTGPLVDLLLARGADVNCRSRWSRTPLHLAAATGNHTVCDLLLRHGAKVDECDLERYTPLAVACSNQHLHAADVLLRGGASAAVGNANGVTPLHWAALRGNAALVSRLLEAKAPLDAADREGNSPLDLAAGAAQVNSARVLFDAGADPFRPNAKGASPFMAAAARGCVPIVRLFMTAMGNGAGEYGGAALHVAAAHDRAEIIELLVDAGVAVDATDNSGRTALFHAVHAGAITGVTELLKRGANCNITGANGITVLHVAAKAMNLELVRRLLDAGASVHAPTADGWTPLLEAVVGSVELCALLISRGADVNAQSFKGFSPLYRAAGKGSASMVRLLLQHGADPNAADCYDSTPWDAAQERGDAEVREAFEAHAESSGQTLPKHDPANDVERDLQRIESNATWVAENYNKFAAHGMVRLEKGSGNTMEDALRFSASHAEVLVRAEYEWLEQTFGPRQELSDTAANGEVPPPVKGWALSMYAIRQQGNHWYDEFSLMLPDGSKRSIYFDITDKYDPRGASLSWMMMHMAAQTTGKDDDLAEGVGAG